MALPEQLRPVVGSARGRSASGPITYDEVQELEWNRGFRYEIFDGVLVVNPSPRINHQRAVAQLFRLLDRVVPHGLEVVLAPFDWKLSDENVYEPDLLVVRQSDLTERHLAGPPVIAVEVLSPSTRRFDLLLKRDAYAAGGAGEYWVVDPDEPSLLVLRLGSLGAFEEVAAVRGGDAYEATEPFPVRVVPGELPSGPE